MKTTENDYWCYNCKREFTLHLMRGEYPCCPACGDTNIALVGGVENSFDDSDNFNLDQ